MIRRTGSGWADSDPAGPARLGRCRLGSAWAARDMPAEPEGMALRRIRVAAFRRPRRASAAGHGMVGSRTAGGYCDVAMDRTANDSGSIARPHPVYLGLRLGGMCGAGRPRLERWTAAKDRRAGPGRAGPETEPRRCGDVPLQLLLLLLLLL